MYTRFKSLIFGGSFAPKVIQIPAAALISIVACCWCQAETQSVKAESFLTSVEQLGAKALRQTHFSLDIENSQVNILELWVIPKEKLILVFTGVLSGKDLANWQLNGIPSNALPVNLRTAFFNNTLRVFNPINRTWRIVEGAEPYLGIESEDRIKLSSFSEYRLKENFWDKILKDTKPNSKISHLAKLELQKLEPKNGVISYTDSSNSTGLKILLDDNKNILSAKILHNGIVSQEFTNEFIYNLDNIPKEVLEISKSLLDSSSSGHPLEIALSGKPSLGLFIAKNADADYEVVWVFESGPASLAGITEGDIIVTIDGKEVYSLSSKELAQILQSQSEFSFEIRRNGKLIKIPVISKAIISG